MPRQSNAVRSLVALACAFGALVVPARALAADDLVVLEGDPAPLLQGTHTYALVGKYKVDVKVFGHPAGTTIHPTSPLAQFTSVVTVVGHT